MLGKKKKSKAIEAKEEISEEENVISKEEFAALEKEEGKDLLPVEKPKKEKEVKGMTVEHVMLKLEKAEGKIESLDSQKVATDERISRLTEEIGELRSSLLEKERMFNVVETGFGKIKDATEEINPQKIRKEMDKNAETLLKFEAQVESLNLKLDELTKGNEKIKDILSKIKSFENIVAVFEEMQKKLDAVEDDKQYVTREAGKIESIFSEINKKMREFRKYQERIDLNKDMLNEIMKTVDLVELKLEKLASKDDLIKYDEKLKNINLGYDDKVQGMKDLMKKLVVSMKQKGFKNINKDILNINKDFASTGEIAELKKMVESLHNRFETSEKAMKDKNRLPPDYEKLLKGELTKMEALSSGLKDKMEDIENKYFEMVSKNRIESKSGDKVVNPHFGLLVDRIRKLEAKLEKPSGQPDMESRLEEMERKEQERLHHMGDRFEKMNRERYERKQRMEENRLDEERLHMERERQDRLEDEIHSLEAEMKKSHKKDMESKLKELEDERDQTKIKEIESKVEKIGRRSSKKMKSIEEKLDKLDRPLTIVTEPTIIEKHVPISISRKGITNDNLEDEFEEVISAAQGHFRDGNLEMAQDMYEKANLVYSQLKINRPYGEAMVYFNQMKELYDKIYNKAVLNM